MAAATVGSNELVPAPYGAISGIPRKLIPVWSAGMSDASYLCVIFPYGFVIDGGDVVLIALMALRNVNNDMVFIDEKKGEVGVGL